MSEDSTIAPYRIECVECGATQLGDPGNDVGFDKEYHRDHYCPGADFEVTYG